MDALKQKIKSIIEYIKTNRYSVYFLGAIALLIILIIALITAIFGVNKNKTSTSKLSPAPSSQEVSVSPGGNGSGSGQNVPILTPNPTQTTTIENQTQAQILQKSAVPYTVSNITLYGDNWGVMNITNPDVGGAGVIIKKVDGNWTVVMGPGSLFPTEMLQSIGAPQTMIDTLTSQASPSDAATSPTPTSGPEGE